MDWKQAAARDLATSLGMWPPLQMSAEGLCETIKTAYERRADLNHKIGRALAALEEMDPNYKAIMKKINQ